MIHDYSARRSLGRRAPAVALTLAAICLALPPANSQQNPAGLAIDGTRVIGDLTTPLAPSQIHVGGLLGERYLASEKNRLLKIDENELLDGFRHRPGQQPWIGEHVGKWLHAASLTYACTHDAQLRAKLDRVANALMDTQEADGYLGTYTPDKRFGLYANADWDVWCHKYNTIGLLTYYQYTGNARALHAAGRIGDLLIQTFGPGKRSINSAGTMQGMAATSVLEPTVLLYRATGEQRYLDFAKYIVTAWDEPGGPRVLSDILAGNPVYRIANAKAYEMTSNLVGLCELYRVTGKKSYLAAPLKAWQDIAANRLYITGGGSSFELWQEDHDLPNGIGSNLCETCVTVTWMQLNMELLRITGESRFADALEKTLYNHLLGAQKPSGDDWSYYTPLLGIKRYDAVTTCCHSSGPRGVALSPTFIYTSSSDGVNVNFFSTSQADVPFRDGTVRIRQTTDYPLDGAVKLAVSPSRILGPFALRLRVPTWSQNVAVMVNGSLTSTPVIGGYAVIERAWKAGDTVQYSIDMTPRIVTDEDANPNKLAVMYGPLVLAADAEYNKLNGVVLGNMTVAAEDSRGLRLRKSGTSRVPLFQTDGVMYPSGSNKFARCKINLVPYYTAGSTGANFAVWLPRASKMEPTSVSLFAGAAETRSRTGNVAGSICDGLSESHVVTFDGTKPAEDWYCLTSKDPVAIGRAVFTQGKMFHDGGWFDTSSVKPRIQAQKVKDGPWEDLGVLDSYPATTGPSSGELKMWQDFQITFPPVSVFAIRVVGVPACGDNPAQAFSSCGELSAFAPSH